MASPSARISRCSRAYGSPGRPVGGSRDAGQRHADYLALVSVTWGAAGTWLARDDFTRYIYRGAGTAAIDWEAAVAALDAGELPSSGGEKRILRLAASLAGQATVGLGEAITGIDDHNVGLLVKAVLHASGRRQFPSH